VDKVDNWIRSYNEQRPDSSGRCRFGRTPMRPFLDAGSSLARDKRLESHHQPPETAALAAA
jgi:hypothetical protein